MGGIAMMENTRRTNRTTDSWITPPWVIKRFGPFDLDPCACIPQPWPTAARMLTEDDDGLLHPWHGFVWMNPPYGRALRAWLNRMALHNNGIALTFARTETGAFQETVFPFATCLLFLRGRMNFHLPCGGTSTKAHNASAPSVLIGYGEEAARRLDGARDLGALLVCKERL